MKATPHTFQRRCLHWSDWPCHQQVQQPPHRPASNVIHHLEEHKVGMAVMAESTDELSARNDTYLQLDDLDDESQSSNTDQALYATLPS